MSHLGLCLEPQLALLPMPKVSHVLVDDDECVHMGWRMCARARNIPIRIYSSPQDFLEDISEYDHSTTFFVDYDMKTEINGIDLARIIKRKLSAEVILCTGHPSSMFDEFIAAKVIDRVSGKEFIAHEYVGQSNNKQGVASHEF